MLVASTAGASLADSVIDLPPIPASGPFVVGTVTGPDGPVVGASVALYGAVPPSAGSTGSFTTTDPSGAYRFNGVEPGRYRITVHAPGMYGGYAPSLALDAEDGGVYEVAAASTLTVDVTLRRSASITGRVTDSSSFGAPVSRTDVWATSIT
ncbi:MAG: carboxypeptidase-like regulatory domain-containing protein, partial [Actinobacteria bacterium]|nr:carboxypeptidase-like regulatory domain-containing protein [Actinomycetota bacterium]